MIGAAQIAAIFLPFLLKSKQFRQFFILGKISDSRLPSGKYQHIRRSRIRIFPHHIRINFYMAAASDRKQSLTETISVRISARLRRSTAINASTSSKPSAKRYIPCSFPASASRIRPAYSFYTTICPLLQKNFFLFIENHPDNLCTFRIFFMI